MEYIQIKNGIATHITTQENIEWSPIHYCTPSALTPEEAELFKVYQVHATPQPFVDHITQVVVRDGQELLEGKWQYKWRVVNLSTEQILINKKALVPTQVTMRQARLALLAAGLLDDVEGAITTAGPAAKIEWEYAQEVQRNSGLVPTMASALGMTELQIDELFTTAATL